MLERKHGGGDAFLFPFYCMEGEFEEIIMKLRWSIKDINNKLQSKFHWLLFSISYKF